MLQCCLQKFAVGEILLHEEKIDRFSGCVKLFNVGIYITQNKGTVDKVPILKTNEYCYYLYKTKKQGVCLASLLVD